MSADRRTAKTMSKAMTPSDDDLLRRMMAGDEEALTALYRRHQGNIYRFSLLMSGSAATADDVTQEVFLALMRGGHGFDSTRGPLAAFLYGIARNQVLRSRRWERIWDPLEEETEDGEVIVRHLIAEDDPLADIVRGEMIGTVRQAVLALPAHYREVVVLCDFQELSYAEAAVALDCALGTVSSRLNRARTMLAERLRTISNVDAAALGAVPLKCLV
jgi:RNA polymerase sigma-70 factor, ECF subfamily